MVIRQGPHQVAHRSRIRILPAKSLDRSGRPCGSSATRSRTGSRFGAGAGAERAGGALAAGFAGGGVGPAGEPGAADATPQANTAAATRTTRAGLIGRSLCAPPA